MFDRFTIVWIIDGDRVGAPYTYTDRPAGMSYDAYLKLCIAEGEAKGWQFDFCHTGWEQ